MCASTCFFMKLWTIQNKINKQASGSTDQNNLPTIPNKTNKPLAFQASSCTGSTYIRHSSRKLDVWCETCKILIQIFTYITNKWKIYKDQYICNFWQSNCKHCTQCLLKQLENNIKFIQSNIQQKYFPVTALKCSNFVTRFCLEGNSVMLCNCQ